MIVVCRVGGPVLVQDAGRVGHAHLGVPAAGAFDPGALAAANLLVGNDPDAAGLEIAGGGLRLDFPDGGVVALTGARVPQLRVGGRYAPDRHARAVPPGGELDVGTLAGARAWLAVRGGVAVTPVLGSRSYCSLSGLGPPPLRAGAHLPVGPQPDRAPPWAAHAVAPDGLDGGPAAAVLDVLPPPRDDLPGAYAALLAGRFTVANPSDRAGVRLASPPLPARAGAGDGPSEGMVSGAVQVTPDGTAVVLGPDHGTVGGYPLAGVVATGSLPLLAQRLPGDPVRFRAPVAGSPPGGGGWRVVRTDLVAG